MRDFLAGLKALGPARLGAMVAAGVAILALMAVLALRGGNERLALLYSELDTREAGQIADQLDRQHIPHQVGNNGTEILVAESLVGRARLSLAREGLPSGGAIGYEIFDRGDGLVASQFQQQMNQTRALEGELARTIRGIQGVRNARVHVVLPHREAFASTHTEAQASVLLTLVGANRIDPEGVQAILTLIAAAVPGLRPHNVAIIDSHGNLLARAGDSVGPAAATGDLADLRRATELRLSRAVEEMLEPSLGSGRVRAEAAVDLDFDQVRETEEKFDPEGQVVRGTQNVTASSHSNEAPSSTTVQNNLPNADTANGPSGTQEQKQEETTNYEIGKTVRTVVREQPRIRRISLAVMVDGVVTRDDKHVMQWQPRSAEEIERIATLVRSAVGYDAKRGDHLDVVSMRFTSNEEVEAPTTLWSSQFDKADLMRLGETGLLGLLGVLALLFVLRPMVIRITTLAGGGQPAALDAAMTGSLTGASLAGPGEQMLLGNSGSPASGSSSSLSATAEHGDPATRSDGAAMVSLSNVEGQLRASSIRRIVELVEKHPDESLAIVRAWMHQEVAS